MKAKFTILVISMLVFALSASKSQVRPNPANEKHHLNFEDDTPMDQIGEAHGEFMDGAYVEQGALILTGGYLKLPGDVIKINTYKEISVEIWGVPYKSQNAPNPNMMWSFGQAGNPGKYYLFFTPGRWGTNVAARICVADDAPWANEQGPSFNKDIGDSALHHYVVTISPDSIMKLYADGEVVKYTTETGEDSAVRKLTIFLDKLSNQDAFIGKAVYPDPTWKGRVELFAIWDKALTAQEVKYLYEKGAKREPLSSIKNTFNNKSITVYTSGNKLYLKNIEELNGKISITLYNILGNVVYTNTDFVNGSQISLSKGIYIAKVECNNQVFVGKLFVK